LFDLVHPEDRAAAAVEFQKLLVSGKLIAREWRARRKDGSYRWLLLNASVLRDAQVIYVTAHDLTDQKRTEQALRDSEEKFRELFDCAPVAYHELDMEGVIRRVNQAECALLGYEAGDMLGRPVWEFIAGAEREAGREAIRRKLSGEQRLEPLQRSFLRRDGGEFLAEIHDALVRDAMGKPTGIRSALLDITERKRAEERIEKTLMRQRGISRLQQSLLSPAPLEEKLRKITDAIVRLFDADFSRIWLIRPGDLCERGCPHAEAREGPHVCRQGDRCLQLLASSGRYTHIDGPDHRRVPFGCYKIGRVASGEDPKFVTNDVQNDPGIRNPAWARELGLVSFAGYRLQAPGEETLGVLAVFAKHPIVADEDAMLHGLGSTVARVVKQAAAEEALRAKEYVLSESQRIAHVGSWSWELPMGVAVCAWTPETYRVFGVSQDSFVPSAEGFQGLIHPDDRAAMQAWISACLAGEEPPDLEFRVGLPGGAIRYILGRGHLERDAENTPVRMTGIAQDITERRQAAEAMRASEALHRLLFDSSRDAMMTLAPPSWKFTSGNSAALALFGARNAAEFTALGPWDLSPERQPDGRLSADKAREVIEAAMRDGFHSFEWTYRRLAGPDFLTTVVLTRIEMAGEAFLEATVRDITESRRLEEALKLHAEKLARSNAELERFAYVASHDLQEPLRMVASFTQLLGKRYSGKLDETADRYIEYAVDGARRMQQLIVDLLAYSRVNSKDLDLRQAECEEVMRDAMRNLQVVIDERGAVIDWDTLPTIRVDQGQFTQLFQNLLGNAIKFTPSGERPRIHISAADTGAEWVLSVQDNGIGIEPRHADRVFEIFQRLHTRTDYPGTGIGLAVCKKVVERHGGKIWVESQPGTGSTFRFTVPKQGRTE
jgi:PAS domain S-box-containing protein